MARKSMAVKKPTSYTNGSNPATRIPVAGQSKAAPTPKAPPMRRRQPKRRPA